MIIIGCHILKQNLSKTGNSKVGFTELWPFVNLLKVFTLILMHVLSDQK
jgi:hypothetical protein